MIMLWIYVKPEQYSDILIVCLHWSLRCRFQESPESETNEQDSPAASNNDSPKISVSRSASHSPSHSKSRFVHILKIAVLLHSIGNYLFKYDY
jgi:hypothetical protein